MSVRWIKMLDSLAAANGAASNGFAGIQLPLGTLADLSKGETEEQKRFLGELGLTVEVCSALLPPGVVVTQRGFNIYVWTEYAKRAFRTAAELGCRTLVWNDGRARLLPLEGDTSGAKQQVLQFLAMLCDLSAQYGITVAVEPLSPRRTNYLNSMQDIVELAQVVGRENLSSVLSLRELSGIDLGNLDFQPYSSVIAHVQMENPLADPGTRVSPRRADQFDYLPFLSALRSIEYDRLITLPNDADTESLHYCEELWHKLA